MREISYKELQFNPMTLIGNEWMLITAGTKEHGFNTMTASWGHLGSLWGHNTPTAICYVRPQRYTKEFLDRENLYTLSFYPEEHKSKLYRAPLKPEYFIDRTIIDANYPQKDFHDLYIGEIQKVLVPEV